VAVVNRHEGVRLAEGDYSLRLPETGQVFTLRNSGGDTEMLIPGSGAWQRIFRWDEDGILFVGTEEFLGDPGCRLRLIARTLASALQARLQGDDGEVYD
jgi:hypothetical protein